VRRVEQEESRRKARLAYRGLLRRAEAARHDMCKFYSFVIRNEINQELLKPAPHQVLFYSFVLHHRMAVVRQPVGTGKTFSSGALALWLLGNDATQRGAIVSGAQSQSKKVVSMISDYIKDETLSARLKLVFPRLKPSERADVSWTQSQITVDRPAGIRDPSVAATGFDKKIGGARLSWIVGDDILDDANTATEEGCKDINNRFDARLMSRLDPRNTLAIVTNTPWDQNDLTFHLERDASWPTLTMDIYGNIRISNADDSWMTEALDTMLRPSTVRVDEDYDWYRLRAHDPDPDEEVPLWPERINADDISRIRYGEHGKGGMIPYEFSRLYLCDPMAADAERCERSWIEECKNRGRGTTLVQQYDGRCPVYTGVDLGIGKSKRHDSSSLFTVALENDGSRRVLNIEKGKWSGPVIVDKIIDTVDRYGSSIFVESNAAQDYLRQFVLEKRKDLQIFAHTTGQNKHSREYGVESLFTEIFNNAWIIPCDEAGRCIPIIQEWINAMVYYLPPPAHTSDVLMSCWIAREGIRRIRRDDPPPTVGRVREMAFVGQF
jgi:hypothetical protein